MLIFYRSIAVEGLGCTQHDLIAQCQQKGGAEAEDGTHAHELLIIYLDPTIAVGVNTSRMIDQTVDCTVDEERGNAPLESFRQCLHCNTCTYKAIERDPRWRAISGGGL